MAKWRKEVYRLKDTHQWKARPGNKILVAGRGAARFEFPEQWIVEPGDDSIVLRDRLEPDDDCLLQISVWHLRPGIDWSQVPLTMLLEETIKGDDREVLAQGEVIAVRRPRLELAWKERRVVDPREKREAVSRFCLARWGTIQPLITMDYWPEHAARFAPVWDAVLDTLRLGEYVADPARQPVN